MRTAQFILNRLRVTNPIFRIEPSAPLLLTQVPGPTQESLLLKQAENTQDSRTVFPI